MKNSSLSKDMLEEQHTIERTKVDEAITPPAAKAKNDDDEVIDAMPISYSLPADSVVSEKNNIQLEDQHSMERTKVDEAITPPAAKAENDDDEVIDAMPISYSLPADLVLNKVKKTGTMQVATNPDEGKRKRRASAFEKVKFDITDELLKDWIIETRQRTNGKFDKYYYHMTLKVKCRSKVGVKNFEEGALPKPEKRYEANLRINNVEEDHMKPSIQTSPEKMSTKSFDNINDLEEDTSFSYDDDCNKFESAEDFLRDAYNNLLNSCPHPMPNDSTQDLEEDTSSSCADDCNEVESVEDFLRDAYNNLLSSCPHPMPNVSTQGNEKRRVEVKVKEEEQEEEAEAEAEAQAKVEATPEEKAGEEKNIIDVPPKDDIHAKSNLQEEDDCFEDLFLAVDIPKNF